jgi:hypothetical protein
MLRYNIIIQHPVAFNMHPQGTAIREETTPQKQRTQ